MRTRQIQGFNGTLAALIALTTAVSSFGQEYVEDFSTTTYRDSVNTTAFWDTETGALRLEPFFLSPVDAVPSAGRTVGIALSGEFLFAAESWGGVQILDRRDLHGPRSSIATENARDIEVEGRVAYVADERSLKVLDVANPRSPQLLANLTIPAVAYDVEVSGDQVYVAADTEGLLTIDVTDPSAPALVGQADTSGNAQAVAISGDVAIVADELGGLSVVDISDPNVLQIVGTVPTPDRARDVTIAGRHVFVACGSAGLLVYGLDSPSELSPLGGVATGGFARRVTVSGNRAFVSDTIAGVVACDISDPTNLLVQDSFLTAGDAFDVAVTGQTLYAADYSGGILELLAGQEIPLSPLGSSSQGGHYRSLRVDGDRAIAGAGAAGLVLLDVSLPDSPAVVGSFDTPGIGYDACYLGLYALLADGPGGLLIFDVQNPTQPLIAGLVPTSGSCTRVDTQGDLAFIAAGSNFQVFDVSSPSLPVLLGSYDLGGPLSDFEVQGDRVYAASGSGFHVLDISNPANPVLVVSTTPGEFWGFTDVMVQGNTAFLSNEVGWHVFNISSDSVIELLVEVDNSEYFDRIWVENRRAYLVHDSFELWVYDVSDEAEPVLLQVVDNVSMAPLDLAIEGTVLYTAEGGIGIRSFRIAQTEIQDPGSNIGQSIPIDIADDEILYGRISAEQTSGVSWRLSPDGGLAWQDLTPDGSWHVMTSPGSDLVWRSEHHWTVGQINPSVSRLAIDWLTERPHITSIADIPDDDGRQVRIQWRRSGHDFVGDPMQVIEYGVYRLGDDGVWQFIDRVPVRAEDDYAMVVPTTVDSIDADTPYLNEFRVTAFTADPGVHFDSYAATGYSVDNLPPSVPNGLILSAGMLVWDSASEEEILHFSVYGSTNGGVDGSETLIGQTSKGEYDVSSLQYPYYFVTATDLSGNESAEAVVENTVTGARDLPTRPALIGNHPNPFNPQTVVIYDAVDGMGIVLTIYDIAGRLIRKLVDTPASAGGRQEVVWDGRDERGRIAASGVYLVQLRAGEFLETKRLVLLK